MAGDWIKMRAELLTHPKVIRMSTVLKTDRLRVIGGLFAVWCLFDAHSEDGDLAGYTATVLDGLVGFKGFSEAMRHVKWLDYGGEVVWLPEFTEHNGKSAKVRAEDSKRKRIERTNVQEKPDKTPDKPRTDSGPEKRREEKKEDSEAKASGGKPPMTPDEIIFGYGVPLLTNAGSTDKHARSFLGGLRKAHGDDSVVNTLRECMRAKPLQPMEWLAAAMLPDAAGTTETRHQKAQREKMERDFPNLCHPTTENAHGHALTLG